MKANRFLSAASIALAIAFTLSCSALDDIKEAIDKTKDGLTGALQGGLMNSNLHFMSSEGIPEGEASIITGVQFISDADGNLGTLIFTSSEELIELYLQVEGKDGYYVKELSSSEDLANVSNGSYAYSVDLDFAPDLPVDEQKIKVGGRSVQGKEAKLEESKNTTIEQNPCNGNKTYSGGYAGFIGSFDMGKDYGSFKFEYETYYAPDEITIYGNSKARGTPIFHYPSGGTNGWKSKTVDFNERIISVKVIGSSQGTAWDFKLHCPD